MSKKKFREAPPWVADAVFYQIFPDRFCNGDVCNDPPGVTTWGQPPTRENLFGGDLQGVINKLDYLQDLGVNAIYLNPIFMARTNHRYDTSDYFKVDPHLGDITLLKELVRQLHSRGMHIIFDGVFNHCGDGFLPFQDVARHGADSQFADWFLARSYPLTTEPLNFLSCGGCTYLPKFNHANQQVQQFLIYVGRYWLEVTGMDGWRLDVPFKINPSFWRKFRKTVKSINPQAYLVGEVWREAAPWIKGDTFDGVTNYRLRDLIFDYVNTSVLDAEDFGYELRTLLAAHGAVASSMLNLLESHDTVRVLTTFNGDLDKLRIALTLQMTLPGAPMIYYGGEVGIPGEGDPDCRRCMPWDESQWNQQIFRFTRVLTQLRHGHPALRCGTQTQLAFFNGVYAYKRMLAEDEVIVIINPRESISRLEIPSGSQHEKWMDVINDQPVNAPGGRLFFDSLPAGCTLVLVKAE